MMQDEEYDRGLCNVLESGGYMIIDEDGPAIDPLNSTTIDPGRPTLSVDSVMLSDSFVVQSTSPKKHCPLDSAAWNRNYLTATLSASMRRESGFFEGSAGCLSQVSSRGICCTDLTGRCMGVTTRSNKSKEDVKVCLMSAFDELQTDQERETKLRLPPSSSRSVKRRSLDSPTHTAPSVRVALGASNRRRSSDALQVTTASINPIQRLTRCHRESFSAHESVSSASSLNTSNVMLTHTLGAESPQRSLSMLCDSGFGSEASVRHATRDRLSDSFAVRFDALSHRDIVEMVEASPGHAEHLKANLVPGNLKLVEIDDRNCESDSFTSVILDFKQAGLKTEDATERPAYDGLTLEQSVALEAVVNKISPPALRSFQIGPKMGRDFVDFLDELSARSVTNFLSCLFCFLATEDLVSARSVSRRWESVVMDDIKAKRRLEEYEATTSSMSQLEEHPSTKENVTIKKVERKALVTRSTPLAGVQRLAKPATTLSPIKAPPSPTIPAERFYREARMLKNDECLLKCPLCTRPARKDCAQERAQCTNTQCRFDYCTNCNRTFHGATDCTLYIGRRLRSDVKIGSRESKRNLRRL